MCTKKNNILFVNSVKYIEIISDFFYTYDNAFQKGFYNEKREG